MNDYVIHNEAKESIIQSILGRVDLSCRRAPKDMLISAFALLGLGFLTTTTAGAVIGTSTAIGIVCKTAWSWKHLITHILYDTYNFTYKPTLNHRVLAFQSTKVMSASLKWEQVTQNQSIPTLKIPASVTSEKTRGYIQGYLLGQQFYELKHQVIPLMASAASKDKNDISMTKLKTNVENLNIPASCREELYGMAEGYREWAKKRGIKESLADIHEFLFHGHILTDTYKSVGTDKSLAGFGCSTVVLKDSTSSKLIVGRLLDWVSLGTIGKILYLKSYSVPLQKSIMQVFFHTFPGFIGGLTCWNDRGLIAIVNELGNTTLNKGTPFNLFVKELIEQATSVEEAQIKIIEWQSEEEGRAASSFTLTLADKENATMFHFYPAGVPKDSEERELPTKSWNDTSLPQNEMPLQMIAYGVYARSLKSANTPLIVTNHAYIKMDEYIETSPCSNTTKERLVRIHKANSENRTCTTEIRVMRMLQVANVTTTIAAYIFDTSNATLKLGCDNYNAAHLLDKLQPFALYH